MLIINYLNFKKKIKGFIHFRRQVNLRCLTLDDDVTCKDSAFNSKGTAQSQKSFRWET